MKFTKAKMWVAAVGNTLTAVQVAIAVLAGVLSDDTVGVDEVSPLITAAVTLGVTVWGVWRITNEPVPDVNTPTVRGRV